jgi:hypothetical protein
MKRKIVLRKDGIEGSKYLLNFGKLILPNNRDSKI